MSIKDRGYRFGRARISIAPLVAVCAAVVGVTRAFATPGAFSDSAGELAASATFEACGNNLVVTLTNTSLSDVLVSGNVLSAVFFDLDATGPVSLTPLSAVLGPGSSVLFGGTDPGGVVGGEWAWGENLSGAPADTHYGISSAGFGLFGPLDLFPGSDLQAPVSPDGIQYGITSAGDDPATGNTAVTGTNALIQNQVVFTLSGLPDGLDPATQITNVHWQYGTSFDEPGFPEPVTLSLLAVGSLAVMGRRRRR